MNNDNYLVESIIDNIKNKRDFKNKNKVQNKEFLKKQQEYIRYQQRGGKLSMENFQDPLMRKYEIDHNKNPKEYPNFRTWKKKKMEEDKIKTEIEDKKSKIRRRNAQAKHDESVAEVNKLRAEKMKKSGI